jgi:hypothetical protein
MGRHKLQIHAPLLSRVGSPPIREEGKKRASKKAPAAAKTLRSSGSAVIGRNISASNDMMLERVQRAHFQYFLDYQDKTTGLILDRTRLDGPATIAGVGFALSAYGAACKRLWVSRAEAAAYTLRVLRTLWNVPQGEQAEGTNGYRGFFYHFLNPATGTRATAPQFWNSELSSIDTALLMAGVRFARYFYRGKSVDEVEIRDLADKLYNRVEWTWLVRENGLIGHGWTPEGGLIPSVYAGYSEAPLLYLLALGSPTHPAPAASWDALFAQPEFSQQAGKTYVSMPGQPLFCYQFPQSFIDFRGIKDKLNRKLGFDYFENSKRATLAQHQYAIDNPQGFRGYDRLNWGLTACDGPGDVTKVVDGKERTFSWYRERGCLGHDDGTIAPTAAISSLPFAPMLVLSTIRGWLKRPELFYARFCRCFQSHLGASLRSGWVDAERIAIDQPIVPIENYRLAWFEHHVDPALVRALRKADFQAAGSKIDLLTL